MTPEQIALIERSGLANYGELDALIAAARFGMEARALVARMVAHGEGKGGLAVGREWFNDARAFLDAHPEGKEEER